MNLAFVIERPTQFEAPFFRFAARDPAHHLTVVFTGAHPGADAFDPELERQVSWGFDLLAGYDHAACPAAGRYRWLRRELAGRDLVIVNGYTQRAYVQASFAARAGGSPTALRLDSVLWDGTARRLAAKRLLFRLLDRRFDLYLAVGSATRDYLVAVGVEPERTGRFPYVVDVESFAAGSRLGAAARAEERRRWDIPAEAKLATCVTKLSRREAPWDLIAAWRAAEAAGHWLLVAGDGPLRTTLEDRVRDAGLRQVRFAGYVPYPELPALYGATDLFVHPVQEERWGVSVAEALACGLPVVASDRVGAARDLIVPGENGFVYGAGDSAALAEALAAAWRLDPAAVGERSRRLLREWDHQATWRDVLAAAARVAPGKPS